MLLQKKNYIPISHNVIYINTMKKYKYLHKSPRRDRKRWSEVTKRDLEEVESQQGAGEKQKCLEVIHNSLLTLVLRLEVVMLNIGYWL